MLDHVFPLWSGPPALESGDLEGQSFYGWRVLTLAVRYTYPIRLESRIVYAHLFEEGAEWAILRALSWDDRRAQRSIWEKGQSTPLTVPVRFVRLPLSQLHGWLAAFKDQSIIADQTIVEDATQPIRRLRIEWEYTSCVIEKIWKGSAPENAALLEAWIPVWQEMGEALHTAPQLMLEEVTELFGVTAPDSNVYREQEYNPDWLSLP